MPDVVANTSSANRRCGFPTHISGHLYIGLMFVALGITSLVLFIATLSGLWLVLLVGSVTLTWVVFLTRPTYSNVFRLAIARGDTRKKKTIDLDRVAPVTCSPCGESCSICLGEFYTKRKLSLANDDLNISSTFTLSSVDTVATANSDISNGIFNVKSKYRTLPCGHSYHDPCLVEWIKHEGDDFSCPLCRWKPTVIEDTNGVSPVI